MTFIFFDDENSGLITKEKWPNILKKLGLVGFTDEDLNKIFDCYDKYQTGLTNETNTMLHELWGCKKAKENYSDSGALRSSIYLTDALIDKLTSYKEYRELYLLKQSYQENKDREMN